MNLLNLLALLCFLVALAIPLWLFIQLKLIKPYKAKQVRVSKVLPKIHDDVIKPISQQEIKVKNNKRRPNPWDKASSKPRLETTGNKANKVSSKGSSRVNQAKDSKKYKQLLSMLNGDRVTADNLVKAYGVDKAIEDLIRDRR